MTTSRELNFEVDTEYLEHNAAEKRSLRYEFVVEKIAGTWIVIRKSDRFEFLARDESSKLRDALGELTPLGHVLSPKGSNIMEPIMRIFNHENLINMIDYIQIQPTETARFSKGLTRHFFIWDFCNAGTLENLFFAERQPPSVPGDAGQRVREFDQGLPLPEKQAKGFLPEAFCWHVLVSMLKALAWLHNGLREDWDCIRNAWVKKGANIDWQTILHRNIRPDNIFFCHPQTRFETYGLCKLGNFSNAFVSGVFNGVHNLVPPAPTQKVLANSPGCHRSYRELRKLDSNEASAKQFSDEIYTITSEYRALGDVIVAMMIPPERHSEALRHFAYIKSLPETQWKAKIAATPYTKVLKNLVSEFYELKEHRANNLNVVTSAEQVNTFERDATFALYRKARDLYDKFRSIKDEGKDVVTVFHVQSIEDRREREAAAEREREEKRTQDLLYYFNASNRFNNDAKTPTKMDLLLKEIDEVCEEINSTTSEAHFRPGEV